MCIILYNFKSTGLPISQHIGFGAQYQLQSVPPHNGFTIFNGHTHQVACLNSSITRWQSCAHVVFSIHYVFQYTPRIKVNLILHKILQMHNILGEEQMEDFKKVYSIQTTFGWQRFALNNVLISPLGQAKSGVTLWSITR